jgi:uncharacterized protein YacL
MLLGIWTLAWVLSMALAVFGPQFAWGANDTLSLLAVLINLAVGFGMIMANIRHLKGLDELQQRIQLEAMGLTLGIGLVAGLAYSNLALLDLIPFDAEISHFVIMMCLTYAVAVFAGSRRYQ